MFLGLPKAELTPAARLQTLLTLGLVEKQSISRIHALLPHSVQKCVQAEIVQKNQYLSYERLYSPGTARKKAFRHLP